MTDILTAPHSTGADLMLADLPGRLAAFRREHAYREVTVGGARWHYLTGGRGDRTLLLPAGGTRVPDPYLLLIGALEPDCRVLAPTYPPLPGMAGLADGLAAILDAEDVDDADVLGSSFGGFVAQCLVRRHPARVRRLVLPNTGAPGTSPLPGLAVLVRLFALLPEGLARRATGWNWRRWLVVPPTERAFWHGLLGELLATRLCKADLVAALAELLDYSRQRFAPGDLATWPGRILLIESARDEAFPPAARAALRALYPQARVLTFPGAGHAVMLTRPDVYVAAVRAFLAEP